MYYVGIPGFPLGVDPDIATFGETEEHARQMAKECIELILESALEDNEDIPKQKEVDTSNLIAIDINEALAFVLWLREQRSERKLSQSQTAKILGISTKDYHRLENPKQCNPTMKTLSKIRDGFGLQELTI